MKIPRWPLNLAIIFLILLRNFIPFLLFWKFFHFRMIDVMCLFLIYLICDSIEATIVFYTGLWNKTKKIFAHLANILLIFSITAGILLRMPLHYLFVSFGVTVNDYNSILQVWGTATIIIFIFVLIFGYTSRKVWGNIQYLSARLVFLLYCFLYVPWWAIIMGLIATGCLILMECKKYNFDIKEMRKKDPRFR